MGAICGANFVALVTIAPWVEITSKIVGGFTSIVTSVRDLFAVHSTAATNTAVATGNGNCAVSGTGNQVTCAPVTTGTVQVARSAFSSVQKLNTSPTFLGGNYTLRLGDLATLTLSSCLTI
jgi:hypothetical protein